MTFGMRVAVTLAAFVTTVLLAACSGGDAGGDGAGSEDAGSEMRLTLTDDDCTYEGDETPAAGMFTVEVENQSSKQSAFALGRIAAGATIDDLEAYIEEERQRIQQEAEILGEPAFYSQEVRVGVAPGTSGLLPADVEAGTYALTCFNDPPLTALYVAGQLDVTE